MASLRPSQATAPSLPRPSSIPVRLGGLDMAMQEAQAVDRSIGPGWTHLLDAASSYMPRIRETRVPRAPTGSDREASAETVSIEPQPCTPLDPGSILLAMVYGPHCRKRLALWVATAG